MTTIASDARMASAQRTYPPRAAVVSWIFFDWAAQPYFTLITTFVFAPYFATSIAPDPATGQSLWGFAMAAAGLAIALMSPVLGAIADASGRRKPWIAGFGALPLLASEGLLPVRVAIAPLVLAPIAIWQAARVVRGGYADPARWDSLAFWSVALLAGSAGASLLAALTLARG